MQSVIRCIWHPKLNQIIVGCGDGKARLFFNPTHSQRLETVKRIHYYHSLLLEELRCVSLRRKGRRLKLHPVNNSRLLHVCIVVILVVLCGRVSSSAHALPMFRDERVRSLKRTREKARNDPVASHKPEAPVVGKGKN